MKKAMMILAMAGILFSAGLAMAQDITASIIIPEEYVARLTTMITAKYMHPGNASCNGMTLKECFIKMMIVEAVRTELYQWERAEARKTATQVADEGVSKITVTGE